MPQDPADLPVDGQPEDDSQPGLDRRSFLTAGAQAGLAVTLVGGAGACASSGAAEPATRPAAPAITSGLPDVVVVGAGSFGVWSALNLQEMGARVTLVDKYGPGNSKSTSGGETRGVRTSYGDRPHGLQWGRWAAEAIRRWKRYDEEWGADLLPRLFYTTGDVIMREERMDFLTQTAANWDAMDWPYEWLTPEEVRYRWPVIGLPEIGTILYEPEAGVVRARRTCEAVARVFERAGGTIQIANVRLGSRQDGLLHEVQLEPGTPLKADTFVFALGPWMPLFFPEILGKKMRIPMGHVFYYGTPSGDTSYNWPNLPSYNVSGVTGWPAIPPDYRGFRVRTGGQQHEDPDTSPRWIDAQYHERPRTVLEQYFPRLADAPILETRACHYDISIGRNFMVDHHPDLGNVWLAGAGSAESFKFGPVIGEYVANRVLERDTDPELDASFKIPEAEYEERQPNRRPPGP